MDVGLVYFPTHYGMPPADLAKAAEERGFESLLFCEHTHIPASRDTPNPEGGELPKMYWHTYDPFVACAAAATVTTRLKIGTGICLIVQRDPITTAKEVASIDQLSEGRFLFGIGAGWNREEMRNHGTNPRTRMTLMAERVEAMREIWTKEEAAYSGKYVNFEPLWAYPKPVQSPLPVLVGGMGPTVEDRVLAFGDGWFADASGVEDIEVFAGRVRRLQERAAEVGRGPLPICLYGLPADVTMAERFAAAGVTRGLYYVEDRDPASVVADLDRLAQAYAQLRRVL
jgi:probable F420-dependent oxidoreductase